MSRSFGFTVAGMLTSALIAGACGGKGEAPGGAGQASAAAPPAAASVPAATTPAAGADGRAVYQRTCVTCHQQNGQGIQGTFPPLAENPVVAGDKARLINLVLHGLSGPVMVKGVRYNNVMPPWKTLSDADMAAVLTYVRSNFGNTADAVAPAEVAAQRAATASRTSMWTAAELDLH
jgi:mono/diheme cytochrome c family protein